MLMFQASSAPARSGILEALGEVHLADDRPLLRGEVVARDVGAVDAAPGRAVEVEEPGAGPAQVPGDGGEQRAGAHRVAAHRLTLHALPEPQEGRARAVEVRRTLDVGRRDTGRALAPLGRARGERRLELVEARRVVGEERPVRHAVADEDVQEREGECRVGAGERLQVQVGALGGPGRDRVDHDDRARRLGQPVLVGVRRGRRGVGAPDEDAGGVGGAARVEPDLRRAVEVVQGDVPGEVADRVGVDLGRAEPVDEAQPVAVAELRERAGVVGVEDRLRTRGGRRRPSAARRRARAPRPSSPPGRRRCPSRRRG